MGRWNLDNIDWGAFDFTKIEYDLVKIVRAASMVEYRSADYVTYLSNVFAGDKKLISDVKEWGLEEEQHGIALANWVALVDPTFDFNSSFLDFKRNYRLRIDSQESIRGSRTAELLSRCVVEIGTSSFYSAISDASEEPVLKQICSLIARDEFAHYGLFRHHMQRYQLQEKLNCWKRISIALRRILEVSDDELAYAFYASNEEKGIYNRKRASAAYGARALKLYKPAHVEKGVRMLLRAIGFSRGGYVERQLSTIVYTILKFRARRLEQELI